MSYREVARERKQFLMTHLQIGAMGADQCWHYQALLTVFLVGCFLGGLSILPCLVTGHYLIKKIKTWPKFRVVTAPGLKFRVGGQPTTMPPPCRAPVHNRLVLSYFDIEIEILNTL